MLIEKIPSSLKKLSILVAIGIILHASKDMFSGSATYVASANRALLFLSLGSLLAYRLVNAAGWSFIVRALGGSIDLHFGIKTWLSSEALRWLPGSVWGFVSRAYQGQKAGLSKKKAAASLPIEVILTLLAWIFTAAWTSLLCGQASFILELVYSNFLEFTGIFLVAVILLCVMMKRSSGNLERKIISLKDGLLNLKQEISISSLVKILAFYTALCIFNGICFYITTQALGLN